MLPPGSESLPPQKAQTSFHFRRPSNFALPCFSLDPERGGSCHVRVMALISQPWINVPSSAMSICTRWFLARVTSSGRDVPDILKIAIPDTDNVFTILLEGLLTNVSEYKLGRQPVMTWLTKQKKVLLWDSIRTKSAPQFVQKVVRCTQKECRF
jgi:hypothetical protein